MTRDSHRGSALLVAVLLSLIAGALAMSVLLSASSETMVGANHRQAHVLGYIADAALQRTVFELATVTWTTLPGDGAVASYHQLVPVIPAGPETPVSLTAALQRASDARYGGGANRPVWRIFAQAPAHVVLDLNVDDTSAVTITWIADDSEEQDGRPESDTNGVLLVRAEAFGFQGGRRGVEALVRRENPGGVAAIRMLTWRAAG